MVDLFKKLNSSLANPVNEDYLPLKRSLKRRQGFGILFVRCTPVQINPLVKKIKRDIPEKTVAILNLEQPIDNLYDLVAETYSTNLPDILFIRGVEKSLEDYIKPGIKGQGDYYKLDTVPPLLSHLNWQRERFRDNFPICFVFLIPSFVLKYFVRRAPDFFDWRSGTFELITDQKLVNQETQRILSEGDFQKYQGWTPQQRQQKILEIKEILQESYQTYDNQAYLWLEIGELFFANQEYEEAIDSCNKALEFKPEDHYTWYNRGVALGNLGRLEEAIDSYNQALEFKLDDHEAWNNRGNALGNLGRLEEAIDSYNQALEFKPDYHKAWKNRGIALGNLGRLEEAIDSYNQALEFKLDDHEAWNNRGIALGNLGRLEETIDSYNQALEFKPDYYKAWYNRGNALRNLGRLEEAIDSYNQALEFKPDYYKAWYNRGNALRNLGRLEEAIDSYNQALEFKPDYYKAWYNKACIYALQNQVELAIENLQQAINLDAEYRDMAKTDSDFDAIRSDSRFQALLS